MRRRQFFSVKSAKGTWKRPSAKALARISAALEKLVAERVQS